MLSVEQTILLCDSADGEDHHESMQGAFERGVTAPRFCMINSSANLRGARTSLHRAIGIKWQACKRQVSSKAAWLLPGALPRSHITQPSDGAGIHGSSLRRFHSHLSKVAKPSRLAMRAPRHHGRCSLGHS